MVERLIQYSLGLGCIALIAATATTAPTTLPTTRHASAATTAPIAAQPTVPPVPEKHEPVPPPPPPPVQAVAPQPAPILPVPTTQPVTPTTAVVIVAPTTQPGPIADPVAYSIGYAAGAKIRTRLATDGRPADDLQILRGVLDGLGDHDPAFPREVIQARLAEFQAYNLQRQAEKQYADDPAFRKQADENLQKSRALMAQNAELAGVEVLPDGVQRQTIKVGSGRVVGNAKSLTVNLKVSLADGTMVKTTEPGKTVKLAVADSLPAVIDASRGMRVGGIWRVLLPPDKAYGLAGKPPVIGPNEAVEYEIELIAAE